MEDFADFVDYIKVFMINEVRHCYDNVNEIYDFDDKLDLDTIKSFDSLIGRENDIFLELSKFLRAIRYDTEYYNLPIDRISPSIYDEYKMWNGNINELLKRRILNFLKEIKKDPVDIEKVISSTTPKEIENVLILEFYKKLCDFLEHNKNMDRPIGFSKSLDLNLIKNLLYSPASNAEKSSNDTFHSYIQSKIKRYKGLSRIGYWEDQDISTSVCRNAGFKDFLKENFKIEIFENNNSRVLFIKISLLLMLKYHIKIHNYGIYDLKFIKQYIDQQKSIEGSNNEIERSVKIFAFTRLVSRYFFPLLSDTDLSYSFSLCIQAICYLRRGSSYLLHNKPEEGFNDLTFCEMKLTNLSTILSNKKDENYKTVAFFHDLIVPYVSIMKGEIYRRNYSFYNAHQYFCNAQTRLDYLICENESKYYDRSDYVKFLNRSIKNVTLKIAKGKTFLELGEFRKSLKWFFNALCAYFNCVDIDENKKANCVAEIKRLRLYLEETRLHMEIRKFQLYGKINRIISALEHIIVEFNNYESKYSLLLCDLFIRISLVIGLLNIPDYDCVDDDTKLADDSNKDCGHINGEINIRYRKNNELSRKFISFSDRILHKCGFKKSIALQVLNKLILGNYQNLPNDCPYEMLHSGGVRGSMYRSIAINVLKGLDRNQEIADDNSRIARHLIKRLFVFTEEFSSKNGELYKYLMKDKLIDTQRFNQDFVYIYGLQRWSSINPALVRPSAFKIKGGGLFLFFKGKGIAIDPGINFIENLYSEGFSISDIDCIIATHDHVDHIADIDTILAAHYRRSNIADKTKKPILKLVCNTTVSQRYSFISNLPKKSNFEKIELSENDDWRILYKDSKIKIKSVVVNHHDLSSPGKSNTQGIILKFDEEYIIGITSDTYFSTKKIKKFINEDLDILIAHINGCPFRELVTACFDEGSIDIKNLNSVGQNLKNEILYSLSYDNLEMEVGDTLNVPLGADPDSDWEALHNSQKRPLGMHLLLYGVLKAYDLFCSKHQKSESNIPTKERLFLIAETNEEMGGYRHKVTRQIVNKKNNDNIKCFTTDIGFCARIGRKQPESMREIEIKCSYCALSNDYHEDDQFHPISNMNEVCLRREEEGIFYFCKRHDPVGSEESNEKEFRFIERLERYQPFRHIDIRL